MFGYLAGSVADRWRDIEGLSDHGRLMAERIKELVPTGNIPSIGSPKWRADLLFDLVQPMDEESFWAATEELCEKGLFMLAFTYPGRDYGYYREVEILAARVIAEEKEFDVTKVSFVFLSPEDIQLAA